MPRQIWPLLLSLFLLLGGCASADSGAQADSPSSGQPVSRPTEGVEMLPALKALELVPGEKLRVVATTNLVADVVGRIGGDAIDLTSLLPAGADPHGYQATPADLRTINDADLLFVNGLGLEEALGSILDEAQARTVPVNAGVALIAGGEEEEGTGEDGKRPHSERGNPHTWWSIAAVEQWTHTIAQSLAAVDPAHEAQYAANGVAYRTELASLRVEIEDLVARLAPEERKFATDHNTLAYFAQEFGFEIVGLVIPSFSTMAEPSARHLAQLQNQIRAENVRAILVGSTVNPRQAEQLAQDLGIRVVTIFTDSLSEADGAAATYLDFMRYNVGVIVQALEGGE